MGKRHRYWLNISKSAKFLKGLFNILIHFGSFCFYCKACFTQFFLRNLYFHAMKKINLIIFHTVLCFRSDINWYKIIVNQELVSLSSLVIKTFHIPFKIISVSFKSTFCLKLLLNKTQNIKKLSYKLIKYRYLNALSI